MNNFSKKIVMDAITKKECPSCHHLLESRQHLAGAEVVGVWQCVSCRILFFEQDFSCRKVVCEDCICSAFGEYGESDSTPTSCHCSIKKAVVDEPNAATHCKVINYGDKKQQ